MEVDISDLIIGTFTLACTLIIGYIITRLNKKDNKTYNLETKNAIKSTIETQKILPKIIDIIILISSKIKRGKEIEDTYVEQILYSKESWHKLDSNIRSLEEEVNELAKIDSLYRLYNSYNSMITYGLVVLLVEIFSSTIVYLINFDFLWVMWGVFTAETLCVIVIYKYKQMDVCKQIESYESTYYR